MVRRRHRHKPFRSAIPRPGQALTLAARTSTWSDSSLVLVDPTARRGGRNSAFMRTSARGLTLSAGPRTVNREPRNLYAEAGDRAAAGRTGRPRFGKNAASKPIAGRNAQIW